MAARARRVGALLAGVALGCGGARAPAAAPPPMAEDPPPAAPRELTLLRDREGWVPLPPGRVLSLTLAPAADRAAGAAFDAALREAGYAVQSARVEPDSATAYGDVLAALDGVDLVVASVHVRDVPSGADPLPAAFRAFLRAAELRHPTVVVSFGTPRLLAAGSDPGTILLAWEGSAERQAAAARTLAGIDGVTGVLPIDLPPWHHAGDGLERAARGAPRFVPEVTIRLPRPSADSAAVPRTAATLPWSRSFVELDAGKAGLDPAALDRVDSVIVAALVDSAAPGAALAVGRRGRLVRLRGYGTVDWGDDRQVTPGTLFDLASLTKVVGTTTAAMILEAEGRLDLDAPVARYLPWWSRGDARKERATVRHLLLHRAGLPPFRAWFREHAGREGYREAIAAEPLVYEPGSRTGYSDIGLMVLGFVVEAVSGSPLDVFLEERVFGPLGMEDTLFRPDSALHPRIAPTELDTLWRHKHVRGVVHDENAYAMGGVAGHAGLFATAWDLSTFADLMLSGGALPPCRPGVGSGVACTRPRADTVRIVPEESVRRWTAPPDPASSRALGWDTPEGRGSSAGVYLTDRAFGHTGFTGTSLWIDPELDLYVVLLTSRVNPSRDNDRHVALRRAVHDAVARALRDRPVVVRPDAR